MEWNNCSISDPYWHLTLCVSLIVIRCIYATESDHSSSCVWAQTSVHIHILWRHRAVSSMKMQSSLPMRTYIGGNTPPHPDGWRTLQMVRHDVCIPCWSICNQIVACFLLSLFLYGRARCPGSCFTAAQLYISRAVSFRSSWLWLLARQSDRWDLVWPELLDHDRRLYGDHVVDFLFRWRWSSSSM